MTLLYKPGARSGRRAQALRIAALTGIPVEEVYERWRQNKGYCQIHGWHTRNAARSCALCAPKYRRPATQHERTSP